MAAPRGSDRACEHTTPPLGAPASVNLACLSTPNWQILVVVGREGGAVPHVLSVDGNDVGAVQLVAGKTVSFKF